MEFVELFLPAVSEYLEPDSIVFLDKEIFTDIQAGERHVADLVVKGRFKGRQSCFLIHVEPQASRRRRRGEFGKRMFHYFARLTEEYSLLVYPVAVLSYDRPRNPESDAHRVEFPDKLVLDFRFTVIQLNRLNWRDYLRQDNPVAGALMAKMGFAPSERIEVKKECLRMIARLRLDPARTHLLSGFVDTYLKLNAEEDRKLRAEIEKLPSFEREATMEIVTSWLQEGLQQGLQQGKSELVLRLLAHRFGELSARARMRVERLPQEQLDDLAEALLDFTKPSDLARWLREHAPARAKSNGSKVSRRKKR